MSDPGQGVRPRVYEVRHRTRYSYGEEVSASYGRAYLTPRDVPGQWCRSTRIDVRPSPSLVSEAVDFFGNRSTYVEVRTAHRLLEVTATSIVEVTREAADLAALDAGSWEQARDRIGACTAGGGGSRGGIDAVEARDFLLPSPQVGHDRDVSAYAATIFTPARPLGQALGALVHGIYSDFRYRSGVTSVKTTLPEVLSRREGVCQDFAHLAVGCLRSVGLPARYVSGYLETRPPPGRGRLQGADASHAWVSVLVPQLGWVDLDPTNDQPADARYVVAAWGRDYTDVPPLRGVIFTEGGASKLEVAVDVVRLP
jgi:transglutaminase-like putative cysteine protease